MIPIILRDVQLALRSGGGFGLTLAFFLVLVMFVPFGIGANLELLARIAPGMLWIGALLSCILSLDRIFQLDWEDGTLEALATSPIPLSGIVLSKATAHWITTGLPLTMISLPLGYLLNLPPAQYGLVLLSLLCGTPALSFIGAFGAALTVGVKRGGLLLSLLVMPLYIPTLILGAQSVAVGTAEPGIMLALLAALSLCCVVFIPAVSALALRANLR
ncbi:heme exporter protein B [Amylibacter marinus]|uniref:Heme exporter protein B n=1 Tax=Amylibacter marinus TaxID=1475483 RepID=A0ABQ5VU20_9RHOB|nr:heme exporter protein CcmB [Amylibacter marinus]GLQ34713.1 heme exporter protein B [Amylibacter marinus]